MREGLLGRERDESSAVAVPVTGTGAGRKAFFTLFHLESVDGDDDSDCKRYFLNENDGL